LVILTFSSNNTNHNEMIIIHQLDEYYHAFVLYHKQNIHSFGEQHAKQVLSGRIKTILREEFLHLFYKLCDIYKEIYIFNTDKYISLDFTSY
ncbi:unnamed protein product, partial [Rotaria sordida]